jgi:very-short-patch-repair endonuclease
MPVKNMIIGQKVRPEKAHRARELRRQMTAAETILWQRLRANCLGGWHFRRQQVIGGFIVDFYCHAAGLVVELDGAVHEQQVEYDQQRDQVLQALALHVLRIQNQDVLGHLHDLFDTYCLI